MGIGRWMNRFFGIADMTEPTDKPVAPVAKVTELQERVSDLENNLNKLTEDVPNDEAVERMITEAVDGLEILDSDAVERMISSAVEELDFIPKGDFDPDDLPDFEDIENRVERLEEFDPDDLPDFEDIEKRLEEVEAYDFDDMESDIKHAQETAETADERVMELIRLTASLAQIVKNIVETPGRSVSGSPVPTHIGEGLKTELDKVTAEIAKMQSKIAA